MRWSQAVFAAMLMAASSTACLAQVGAAQPAVNPTGKARVAGRDGPLFDIGVSGYQALTQESSGNGTQQTPTNSAGGMLELRYIAKPVVGLELALSYNEANQTIAPKTGACGFQCSNPFTPLSGKAIQVGLDYVLSKKFGPVRPFAVGGLGFFITIPSNSVYVVDTVVRPDYVAGGGVDWSVLPHFGVRLQFRDNFYKAPDLSTLYNSTGHFTQSAEPMGGFYYRF